MKTHTRRDFLKTTGGIAASAALGRSLLADFAVVDMVAQAATGTASVQDAMRMAEHRAKRFYT